MINELPRGPSGQRSVINGQQTMTMREYTNNEKAAYAAFFLGAPFFIIDIQAN